MDTSPIMKLSDVPKVRSQPPADSGISQEEWEAHVNNLKWSYWANTNPGKKPTDEEWEAIPELTVVGVCAMYTGREITDPNEIQRIREEMQRAMELPLPDPDDADLGTFPDRFEYVPGKNLWEKHHDPEKGFFYLDPSRGETSRTLAIGKYYISKLPESMDKFFSSDGTNEGGILCVKNPDGSWGRGETSSVGEIGNN